MRRENREGERAFFIPADWHADRRRGVGAMLRVRNEQDFIEPCLRSIAGFFDEILLVLNQSTDATEARARALGLPHLRVLSYPFELSPNGPGHDEGPDDSVQEIAYFYNWCLAQTATRHVCKWDGDMVALPALDAGLKRRVLRSNLVAFEGTNLAGEHFARLSREDPVATREPRFFRVAAHTRYEQGPTCEVFRHAHTRRCERLESPLYLHFKWAKDEKSATAIWPEDWACDPYFQRLHARRKGGDVYRGPYPDALLQHVTERAIACAREVEDPKGQEPVMREEAATLARLRAAAVPGDLLEIGSKLGKNTVFLADVARSLLPERRIRSVDPFSAEGAKVSLHDDPDDIESIYQSFVENTAGLAHHTHSRKSSRDLDAADVPDGLAFSFIDGEHTKEGVLADFAFVAEHTHPGGVIVVDDWKNGAWPGVGEAYQEILQRYPVHVLDESTKSAFLQWGGRPPRRSWRQRWGRRL